MKEQQRVADELDKVRQKERQKATAFQLKQKQSKETISELRPMTSRKELTAGQESANTSADEMPPPPPPRSMLPTTQSSKPKEVRRPAKPTKEPVKSRPAPMNIKVGVASQRVCFALILWSIIPNIVFSFTQRPLHCLPRCKTPCRSQQLPKGRELNLRKANHHLLLASSLVSHLKQAGRRL